jgi:hypothetical protein
MLSPTAKLLVKQTVELFTMMKKQAEQATTLAKIRSNLPASLEASIKKLEKATEVDDILTVTSDERVSWLCDHFDDLLEDAASDVGENLHDRIMGDDRFAEKLEKLGENIDSLRTKLVKEYGRNEEFDHTSNFSYASALDYLDAALVAASYDTVIVGFRLKSISERMQARKKRARWLKTSSGRAYLRKRALRRKLHKRVDPKRSRLMKQVAKRYHF